MKQMTKEQAPTFEWPATRGPSLDEFEGAPIFLNLESLAAPPVAPANDNGIHEMLFNLEALAAPSGVPVQADAAPEMFMQGTAMDDFMKAKVSFMPTVSGASDASTTVSIDEDQSLTSPPSGLSDDESEAQKDTSATLKISLTDTLGLWSVGSSAHDIGTCKPCAFLWKDITKPGCQNGRECVFCLLCPPGEVKKRKKQKMFMRKVAKHLQYNDHFTTGLDAQFEPQYQNQYAAGFGMW